MYYTLLGTQTSAGENQPAVCAVCMTRPLTVNDRATVSLVTRPVC